MELACRYRAPCGISLLSIPSNTFHLPVCIYNQYRYPVVGLVHAKLGTYRYRVPVSSKQPRLRDLVCPLSDFFLKGFRRSHQVEAMTLPETIEVSDFFLKGAHLLIKMACKFQCHNSPVPFLLG